MKIAGIFYIKDIGVLLYVPLCVGFGKFTLWFSGRFCKISSDQNNNWRSFCNRILNLSGALIFWYG